MAGRRPREAVQAYLRPLSKAVSCVTSANLVVSGYDPGDQLHSLVLNKGKPAKLRSTRGFALDLRMLYRIVPAEKDRGPWKVSTASYSYCLHDEADREILAYHWHPDTPGMAAMPSPHLHLGSGSGVSSLLRKAHVPTGRVAVEEIIRMAIIELGVKPRRRDWQKILNRTEAAFQQFRTW